MIAAGDTVTCTLTEGDIRIITAQRAAGTRPPGDDLTAGQGLPAIVTGLVTDPDGTARAALLVRLDDTGQDTYWALSRTEGTDPGTWTVPPPPPTAPSTVPQDPAEPDAPSDPEASP
jgi:hypothetical protein